MPTRRYDPDQRKSGPGTGAGPDPAGGEFLNDAVLVRIPWEQIGLILAVGFGAAAAAAFPVYRLLLRIGSRQTISEFVEEHKAKQGTPTMGGLIFGLGFFVALLAASFGPFAGRMSPELSLSLWGVGTLYLGFALIGFVDDYVVPKLMTGKRGLGWTQKLGLQLVCALAALGMCGTLAHPTLAAVAVFLILFFSNAYNFADGMDALAGTLYLVFAGALAVIAWLAHASMLSTLLAGLAGAFLPFLHLNKPKAKVFMGDVGALPVGALLGLVVSVLALPGVAPALLDVDPTRILAGSTVLWTALLIASVVMMAELLPVPIQILSVKLRGKRVFPATPIHHAFQKAGWPELKVVGLFVGVQIVCSLAAVALVFSRLPAGGRP